MSKLAYTTANLSDVQLKEQGNQLFVIRKYDDAVSCYTKAIVSLFVWEIVYYVKFFLDEKF